MITVINDTIYHDGHPVAAILIRESEERENFEAELTGRDLHDLFADLRRPAKKAKRK